MAEEVKIPPFGESITTANVSRWHKADGDSVKKGDTLVTLETDKVSQDLEAEHTGTLKILVQEDEEVEVGAIIAEIDPAGAVAASAESDGAGDAGGSAAEASTSEGEVHDIKIPSFGDSINTASLASWNVKSGDFVEKGETLITLESDKVSQELTADYAGTIEVLVEEGEEVEIGTVIARLTEGTGGGASAPSAPAQAAPDSKPATATDQPPEKAKSALAAAAADTARIKPSLASTAPPSSSGPVSEPVQDGRSTRKKMSMLRRKIAQHLVNAQQTAAILSTFNEVDMSAIMKLRKEVQEEFVAKHGVKLGFMSLFTKAVVHALKETPGIRSFIEGNEIIENDFYDIGIAVGTEKGLVVPVIRDCDQKNFAEIELAIADAARKAKDGSMQIEDLQGGIFTISNGGVYGSLLSTPILNPPQSGILGMHTIQQRPVAVDGKVEIRPMMYLALSYDHRIVDGKEAVTFLISIKESLENPARLLLEC